MQSPKITDYLLNRHLSKDKLRNEYNETMREQGSLQTKYQELLLEYSKTRREYRKLHEDLCSFKQRHLQVMDFLYDMSDSLIEMNNQLQKIQALSEKSREPLFTQMEFVEDKKHDTDNLTYLESMNGLKQIYELVNLGLTCEQYYHSLDLPESTDS